MEHHNQPNHTPYEFCNPPLSIHQDKLSAFLASCGLTLKKFGFQKNMPSLPIPRIHGDLEIIYILSGEAIISIDGTTYYGNASDIFILPQYSLCSFQANSGKSGENYYIHIDINDNIAAEQLKHFLNGPLLHPGEDPFLLQCYRWLEMFYAMQGDGSYLNIQSLLHMIFLRIIHLSGSNCKMETLCRQFETKSSQYRLLQQCIQLIIEHRGVISTEDICNKLYVSPTYIRRVFRNLLDESLLNFIRSVRIREAEIMLLTTDEPISSIALNLGFSSPYHFSNEFRKYHSVSPLKYRKLK